MARPRQSQNTAGVPFGPSATRSCRRALLVMLWLVAGTARAQDVGTPPASSMPPVSSTPPSEPFVPISPIPNPSPFPAQLQPPALGGGAAPAANLSEPSEPRTPEFTTPDPPQARFLVVRPTARTAAAGPADGLPEPLADDEAEDPTEGVLRESVTATEGSFVVKVNRSRVFESKQTFTRILIADPRIADVQLLDADQPEPKLLNVYGRMFGETTLTVWFADPADPQTEHVQSYEVKVTVDTEELQERIAQLFPGADVRLRQVGLQLILEGQVPDAKTMADVMQLLTSEMIGGSPLNMGSGGGGGFSGGPGGGGGGTAVAAPTAMSGGAATGGGAVRGLIVADSAGAGSPPFTIINRVHVPGPRQVMLKVKIAELNRTALRQFGMNFSSLWSNGNSIATAVGAIAAGAPQVLGVFDGGDFSLYLNALRQNSLARILAEPNLVTLDGQPAHFLAGGQFPYQVPQASALGGPVITYQFRDFGAILQFVPHVKGDDVIRLDVNPVFSQLNFTLGTPVPGIDQRSARTVVELRAGQTLAIAGLLQLQTNASTTRIPLLGDAPIIGPLFSNNSINTIETELVVLVTPELIAPVDECEVPPSPGDDYMEPNDLEFYFLGRIEGRTGHPFRSTIIELDPWHIMKHVRSDNRWVIGPHGYAD